MKPLLSRPIAMVIVMFSGMTAWSLEISGLVQDKFENPLPGVSLCIQGSTKCVITDAQGKFHVGGSSALRPIDPALVRARLSIREGKITLASPAATRARLQWFDARGSRLEPAQEIWLSLGNNEVTPPPGSPRGIAFLKVSSPGFSVAWRIVRDGDGEAPGIESRKGGAPGGGAGGPASVALAAKVAAVSASLNVTLDKYKAVVYAPAQETETGVVIELHPLGDKILFNGTSLAGWDDKSGGSWKVVGGVLQETGGGGVLATPDNYGSFRLVVSSRMLPGSDHNPNILLWCKPGSTDKRTMGGIQFQPPLGHMWDYVANKDPNKTTMTRLAPTTGLTPNEWNRCEALADVPTATIRFACCMLGTKKTCDATEIVKFTDPSYAKSGPFALMIHDGGQKQEYKDLEIEPDPVNPGRLLSVKP